MVHHTNETHFPEITSAALVLSLLVMLICLKFMLIAMSLNINEMRPVMSVVRDVI